VSISSRRARPSSPPAKRLVGAACRLGFEVLPSAANFIFARHPAARCRKLGAGAAQRGIIVRHFKLPRIDQYLRITVGTDEQCAALMAAMKEIVA
jgi:histidinol-phosphate aminotransferase